MKVYSETLKKEFDVEIFNTNGTMVITHKSLQAIYSCLQAEGALTARYEQEPISKNDNSTLYAYNVIMRYIDVIAPKESAGFGSISLEELQSLANEGKDVRIKNSFRMEMARNRAFDDAFIQLMNFKLVLDSSVIRTFYSSLSVDIEPGSEMVVNITGKDLSEDMSTAARQAAEKEISSAGSEGSTDMQIPETDEDIPEEAGIMEDIPDILAEPEQDEEDREMMTPILEESMLEDTPLEEDESLPMDAVPMEEIPANQESLPMETGSINEAPALAQPVQAGIPNMPAPAAIPVPGGAHTPTIPAPGGAVKSNAMPPSPGIPGRGPAPAQAISPFAGFVNPVSSMGNGFSPSAQVPKAGGVPQAPQAAAPAVPQAAIPAVLSVPQNAAPVPQAPVPAAAPGNKLTLARVRFDSERNTVKIQMGNGAVADYDPVSDTWESPQGTSWIHPQEIGEMVKEMLGQDIRDYARMFMYF